VIDKSVRGRQDIANHCSFLQDGFVYRGRQDGKSLQAVTGWQFSRGEDSMANHCRQRQDSYSVEEKTGWQMTAVAETG
jgi:hypothetical protein